MFCEQNAATSENTRYYSHLQCICLAFLSKCVHSQVEVRRIKVKKKITSRQFYCMPNCHEHLSFVVLTEGWDKIGSRLYTITWLFPFLPESLLEQKDHNEFHGYTGHVLLFQGEVLEHIQACVSVAWALGPRCLLVTVPLARTWHVPVRPQQLRSRSWEECRLFPAPVWWQAPCGGRGGGRQAGAAAETGAFTVRDCNASVWTVVLAVWTVVLAVSSCVIGSVNSHLWASEFSWEQQDSSGFQAGKWRAGAQRGSSKGSNRSWAEGWRPIQSPRDPSAAGHPALLSPSGCCHPTLSQQNRSLASAGPHRDWLFISRGDSGWKHRLIWFVWIKWFRFLNLNLF